MKQFRWALLFACTLTFFVVSLAGFAQATDALGTATGTTITCPTGKNAPSFCEDVSITCPSATPVHAYLKVFLVAPPSVPKGVTVWMSGGPGTQLYDTFTFGQTALNKTASAHHVNIELSFGGPFNKNQPLGWMNGPNGVRPSACNVATTLDWIYQNLYTLFAPGASAVPFCATGNSDGATAIAMALVYYGLDSEIAFAEFTSGPPTANEDWACTCNQPKVTATCGTGTRPYCIGSGASKAYVDPTWSPSPPGLGPICSGAYHTTTDPNQLTFLNDSLIPGYGGNFSYSGTFVKFLYGGADTGAPPVQGELFRLSIQTSTTWGCMLKDSHTIPNFSDGAMQIGKDLVTYCKLPASR